MARRADPRGAWRLSSHCILWVRKPPDDSVSSRNNGTAVPRTTLSLCSSFQAYPQPSFYHILKPLLSKPVQTHCIAISLRDGILLFLLFPDIYFSSFTSLVSNFLLPVHQNFCLRVCHGCFHLCYRSFYFGGWQLEMSPTAKEPAWGWTGTTCHLLETVTFCRAKSFDGFSVDYSPFPNVGTWFSQPQTLWSFHLIRVQKDELALLCKQGQLDRQFWFFVFR